mgnify:CR=1 FL=1
MNERDFMSMSSLKRDNMNIIRMLIIAVLSPLAIICFRLGIPIEIIVFGLLLAGCALVRASALHSPAFQDLPEATVDAPRFREANAHEGDIENLLPDGGRPGFAAGVAATSRSTPACPRHPPHDS